jgi:hypothetical protein
MGSGSKCFQAFYQFKVQHYLKRELRKHDQAYTGSTREMGGAKHRTARNTKPGHHTIMTFMSVVNHECGKPMAATFLLKFFLKTFEKMLLKG